MARVSFDPEVLRVAHHTLEGAGFKVSTAPPDLLEAGCALMAYRSSDDAGYFVAFAELGLIVHYGASHLWGGEPSSDPPAWECRDAKARLDSALSRWLIEAATAPEGMRQAALHRAAYTIGGLVGAGVVGEHEVAGRLENAGLEAGLDDADVKATVKRSLARGAREPWQLDEKPAPRKSWQPSKGGW